MLQSALARSVQQDFSLAENISSRAAMMSSSTSTIRPGQSSDARPPTASRRLFWWLRACVRACVRAAPPPGHYGHRTNDCAKPNAIKYNSYTATHHLSVLWSHTEAATMQLVMAAPASHRWLENNPFMGLSVFTALYPMKRSGVKSTSIPGPVMTLGQV
jgi:hypothetical protein